MKWLYYGEYMEYSLKCAVSGLGIAGQGRCCAAYTTRVSSHEGMSSLICNISDETRENWKF